MAGGRLLVIDPYKECHQIMPELHAMGWEMEFATLATASEHSCDVGLIRLEPLQLMRPETVKEMIRLSGIEWIAAVSPDDLAIGNVGNFVCEWFYDFHTLPFDVQRLAVFDLDRGEVGLSGVFCIFFPGLNSPVFLFGEIGRASCRERV